MKKLKSCFENKQTKEKVKNQEGDLEEIEKQIQLFCELIIDCYLLNPDSYEE